MYSQFETRVFIKVCDDVLECGDTATTPYGKCKVLKIRHDKIVELQPLNWKLSNKAVPIFYLRDDWNIVEKFEDSIVTILEKRGQGCKVWNRNLRLGNFCSSNEEDLLLLEPFHQDEVSVARAEKVPMMKEFQFPQYDGVDNSKQLQRKVNLPTKVRKEARETKDLIDPLEKNINLAICRISSVTGKMLQTYSTIEEACSHSRVRKAKLIGCLRGDIKELNGCTWRYVDPKQLKQSRKSIVPKVQLVVVIEEYHCATEKVICRYPNIETAARAKNVCPTTLFRLCFILTDC